MKMNEYLNRLAQEGHEVTELQDKMRELSCAGTTQISEKEGYDLVELMNALEENLDLNYFVYGLETHKDGSMYVEIVKHTATNTEDLRWY